MDSSDAIININDKDKLNQLNKETNNISNENNALNNKPRFHLKINKKFVNENNYYSNLSSRQMKHFGNIGRNVVLKNKYVFGPLTHICLWLFCNIATVFGWCIWQYANGDFYPKTLYYSLDLLCIVVEYYLIFSYITEPGIIPRNCPEYAIRENEKNEVNEKISEEEKEKPRIFTERKCQTCNIIRPPGVSHCFICDNCVFNFDHHCSFISNCVGKRNHKYFVLFLFWGGLFAIICTILDIITIYHVFVKHYKETLSPIFHGSTFLFILSIVLLTMSIINSFNPIMNFGRIIFTGLAGFGILFVLWKKNIKKDKMPSYYNPYLFVALGIAFGLAIFIIPNLFQQLYFISKGVTIKQNKSINEKIEENKIKNISNQAMENYYVHSFKRKFYNLFKFFSSPIEKSLILPERDLVDNKN